MKAFLFIATAMIAFSGSAAFAGCVEGNRSLFTEPGPGPNGEDHQISVWRTCVNGRYYPKSTTVGKRCKEGATAVFTKDIGNDRQVIEVRTCENGRYYPKTTATITKCAEGRTQLFSYSDDFDRLRSELKVCRNGKYVTP